jgi:phosphotriesterase-related protein
MTVIQTTTGSIEAEELGRTLVHEHILMGHPGWWLDNRRPKFQRAEAISRVVDILQGLRDFGVGTVVDPCPMDLGRDVEFYAEVSSRSGIRLICSTGAYNESMGIPHTFRSMSVDDIAEIYVKELTDGVGYTGIRAGLVKIATGADVITPHERKVITAAAVAAKATGVPILTHTEGFTCGHEQLDIITSQGLPPERVLIGHCDGPNCGHLHTSIAERGAYVGFDRFGLEDWMTDEDRIADIKVLVEAGHRDHVLVSHDSVSCFLGRTRAGADPEEITKIRPNWKITHLFEKIRPAMRQAGLNDEAFDHFVTENPRRFFSC